VLVAAPALLALWMLWRFLPALAWAAVLAISTWPVRQWAIRRGWTATAAAAALTALLGVLIAVPTRYFRSRRRQGGCDPVSLGAGADGDRHSGS
jgi:predicted PurR-regulated permease PerM